MSTAHWTHVLGNTWCIESHLTIPVYFLNSKEVVLLDSGYADRDRDPLDALLAKKGVRVRAILGSHSHNDHNGNHAYFQKTHGAEIILRDTEAATVLSFALMTAAYRPGTAEDMRREFPHLLLKADRTFSESDAFVEIDGYKFQLIPLPGHTPGHTGIITPDNVLYVADALMSPKVMQAAKLSTALDWIADLESKERLKHMAHPKYILAHSGVYDDISALLEENIEDRHQRAEQIHAWLKEDEAWTQNEAEQYLWDKLELHSKGYIARIIFQRNVSCALEYLVRTGKAKSEFRSGSFFFHML